MQNVIDYSSDNVYSINPFQDIKDAFKNSENAPADKYLEHLLFEIKDSNERKFLAQFYQNMIKTNEQKILNLCAIEALCVIKLSKCGNSLDLSNLDKKSAIAVLSTNYGTNVHENCQDFILENCKNEKGEVDLDLCAELCEKLNETQTFSNPAVDILRAINNIKNSQN